MKIRKRYVLVTELEAGCHVWVSLGEPFLRPGSQLPMTKRIRPLPSDSPLIPRSKTRVIVLVNGENLLRLGKRICGFSVQEILHQCAEPLGIAGQPKVLYTQDGKIVVDEIDQVNDDRIPRPPKHTNPLEEAKKELKDYEPISTVTPHSASKTYGKGVLTDASWRGRPHLRNENSLLRATPPLDFGVVQGGINKCVPLSGLGDEALVWVSCGESFKPLVPPKGDEKYNPHPNVPPIRPESRLLVHSHHNVRVTAYKNGWFYKGSGHPVTGSSIQDLLNGATVALSMNLPAEILYDENGVKITDMSQLSTGQIVFAAHTPPFRRTDEAIITQPVI